MMLLHQNHFSMWRCIFCSPPRARSRTMVAIRFSLPTFTIYLDWLAEKECREFVLLGLSIVENTTTARRDIAIRRLISVRLHRGIDGGGLQTGIAGYQLLIKKPAVGSQLNGHEWISNDACSVRWLMMRTTFRTAQWAILRIHPENLALLLNSLTQYSGKLIRISWILKIKVNIIIVTTHKLWSIACLS